MGAIHPFLLTSFLELQFDTLQSLPRLLPLPLFHTILNNRRYGIYRRVFLKTASQIDDGVVP